MTSIEEPRPVFQMCFALKEGVEQGYVFPSEVENLHVSSVFTAPLKPGESGKDIIKLQYKLPGMIDDKNEDFILSHTGEALLIKHRLFPKPVRFSFYYPFDPLAQRGYPYIRSFPYIGKKQEVVGKFTHFVPILPLDIQLMDEAYRKHKIVFVGKTDVFPTVDEVTI